MRACFLYVRIVSLCCIFQKNRTEEININKTDSYTTER